MMTDDATDNESLGVFYMDDNFIDTFSYGNESSMVIDMDKLDFQETTKDYAFYKKKFPLFDDEIIHLFVELAIQEERKEKVVNTVKNVIKKKEKPKKNCIKISREKTNVYFD